MSDEKQNAPEAKPASTEPKRMPIPDKPPVETTHELHIGDKTLKYTARAGVLPLKDFEKDEITAGIFFTAYTLNIDPVDYATRPLMFVFNGGPGSSSVWLHLGAIGPRRVVMHEEGWMPAPPFRLEPNQYTWLDQADLVFIDPVGTGYSRAADPAKKKEFWDLDKDLKSVAEFIRLYLTRYKRWQSPLYLAGESYGTTRAAGLAGHLFDSGIALNGIALISTVLNFQTLEFEDGNDLPYVLFLPTYAATAWYHKKLPLDLQSKNLREVLTEVESWAHSEYVRLLARGDALTEKERSALARKLARYTGIDSNYIEHSNLRLKSQHFFKELLREERRTVGRLDSRFKGVDRLGITETPEFDPSLTDITPPYTSMLYHYMGTELGYETDLKYEILSFDVAMGWQWTQGKFADTSEALRTATAKNPFMKVFLAMGHFDLATPHFATEYTLSHMGLDPARRSNFQTAYYDAGHMIYLDHKSLVKLKEDIVGFFATSLKR